MGLDVGSKTVGVAISDSTRVVALPLLLLERTRFTQDAEALLKLMKERHIQGIVVGLPRHLDGSYGRACQRTQAFVSRFSTFSSAPIMLRDERLSTQAAVRTLEAAGAARKNQNKLIDRTAASYILQSALDHLRRLSD